MTGWIVAAFFASLPYAVVHAKYVPPAVRGLRRIAARWRRRLRHGKTLTRVRGQGQGIERVRSPMEGLPCLFAVTVIEGGDRYGLPHRAEVFTGRDFLIVNEAGRTAVRASGVRIHLLDDPVPPRQLVVGELPRPIREAIARTPLAEARALYFYERTFDDGIEIEACGALRDELAPAGLPLHGMRERACLPTICGIDGVLEITLQSAEARR